MEKLYDNTAYAQKAVEATNKGMKLYIVRHQIEYDVEVLEWNKKIIEVQKYDPETGEPMYDEDGNPIMEEIEVDDYDNPIMVEEEIIDPETGEKKMVLVQKHHTETRIKTVEELDIQPVNWYICIEDNITDGTVNPNYEEEKQEEIEKQFEIDFFNTSLGYVRRNVTMKNGSHKDFLADILPILQVGIPILTYTKDGRQNKVLVTEKFIEECKQQVVKDFYGE